MTETLVGASAADLTVLAHRYLDALAARDASALPLTENARFTENGQALAFGKAFWRTANGPIGYRNIVADPHSGQVGGFAVVGENGRQVILAFRIKSEAGFVSELETVAVRELGALFRPENLTQVKPVFLEPLADSQLRSREILVEAANLYFDGIEQADGDIIPFHKGVVRTENGLRTTNNPDLGQDTIYTDMLLHLGPAEQINTKFFSYIRKVRDRRLSIVDEARGLVFGFVIFDHPGDLEFAVAADGSRVPMPPESRHPSSALLGYLFKIVDGRIREIETAYMIVPFASESGWSR